MTARRLTYNGTTYLLDEAAVSVLVAQGVVKPDADDPGQLRLSLDHAIDEVEPYATVLERYAGDDTGQDLARRRLLGFRYAHRDGHGGG